jgi:signal transduction histidine kinase
VIFLKTKALKIKSESAIPFFQLLVVAIVCLILISLFLITGFMNFQSLNKTLNSLVIYNGRSILTNIQRVAENHFQQLIATPHINFVSNTIDPLNVYRSSVSDGFLLRLTELAHSIDPENALEIATKGDLASVLELEDIWLAVLLDNDGKVIFQNRPFADWILDFVSPVIEGPSDFRTNIYSRQENQELRVIALRRAADSGFVVLGFNQKGYNLKCFKFSFRKAIEDIGLVDEIAYFIVLDHHNRTTGLYGELSTARLENAAADLSPTESPRTIRLNGQTVLEITAPITIGKDQVIHVGLGLKTEALAGIHSRNRSVIFLSTGIMILIAFLSMWFLYANQVRHLKRMRAMERRMGRFERLSALGRLAAGVSHEIRNPLNAISMAVQRLHKESPNKLTNVIKEEIKRLNLIIEEFLGVSKSRKLTFRKADLRLLIDDILLLMKEEVGTRRIKLESQWHKPSLMIPMDREKMKQAVLNVLKNAVEALPDEGTVTVASKQGDPSTIIIEVRDTGKGMGPEEIEQIFDFDYTTKDKGLGLGLALANEIIMGHSGEIRVSSNPGKGTTFEIILPVDGL